MKVRVISFAAIKKKGKVRVMNFAENAWKGFAENGSKGFCGK
jgi:hypothetical protein